MSSQVTVTGKVHFGPDAVPFDGATAYISLLDVSRQDAPSRTVAKQVIRGAAYSAGRKEEEIEFALSGTIEDPRNTYVVSVHIDVDGDGKVSVGDYITTGLYPVATQGSPTENVQVLVQRVKS
ncbi:YbaY family lipoprotein [Nitrososphaera sp.]|uniref:YbaY family lipoprotein n=1 Tax=Nitrososphaera sp. TaxID=1971748 RepID=UPI00307E66C3